MTAATETGLICPLCQTVAPTMTDALLASGAEWRCPVCHQMWSAQRLETVAAYAEYCVDLAARNAAIVRPNAA